MATAVVTALLAVLVLVVTHSFLKLVLEPIQEQRTLIGEVAHALVFYRNVYHLHMVKLPDEEQRQEIEGLGTRVPKVSTDGLTIAHGRASGRSPSTTPWRSSEGCQGRRTYSRPRMHSWTGPSTCTVVRARTAPRTRRS